MWHSPFLHRYRRCLEMLSHMSCLGPWLLLFNFMSIQLKPLFSPHMYSEQIIKSFSLFYFLCSYVMREMKFFFAVVFSCMLCQDNCTSHLGNPSSEPKPIDFPRSLRQQVWPRNSLWEAQLAAWNSQWIMVDLLTSVVEVSAAERWEVIMKTKMNLHTAAITEMPW